MKLKTNWNLDHSSSSSFFFLALIAVVVLTVASFNAAAFGNRHTWFGHIQPRVARDINPDPEIVEVVLVAYEHKILFAPGMRTKVWTYNGGIPGPTIEGNIGNTLIVHFVNFLPEETTVHWHGLETPANMDGSNIAQLAVKPGNYFRYEFPLLRASTFWYHPHIRTNEQVEKGLYGAIVVHDPKEDKALKLPWREHVLLLDDVLLDPDGQVAQPFPDDPIENAITQVNGREGNNFLVNGRVMPRGKLRREVPHRFRLINVSNSRFMRISFRGHTVWRIGGDGGLLEFPIEIPPVDLIPDGHNPNRWVSNPDPKKGVLLTPGERADIVLIPKGRRPIVVEWHDFPRGRHRASVTPDGMIALGHDHHDGKRSPKSLMTLNLFGHKQYQQDYRPPSTLRSIEPIDIADAEKIRVTLGHANPDKKGDITFFVQMKNGMPLPFPLVTPADAPTVMVGDTRIWEIHNLTGGDHNFHTHGFPFQPLETEYLDMDHPENNTVEQVGYLEDKDTILVPKRPGAKGRSRTIVRVAMKFDDTGRKERIEAFGKQPTKNESGGWLFHCHILEHSNRGMMSFFQVLNPGSTKK